MISFILFSIQMYTKIELAKSPLTKLPHIAWSQLKAYCFLCYQVWLSCLCLTRQFA